MKKVVIFSLIVVALASCKKKTETPEEEPPPVVNNCPPSGCIYPDSVWNQTGTGPHIKFVFKFDSTQVRLNNLGQPTGVGAGNAGFSPKFNKMSAHYIEMATNDITPVGQGKVLY